MIRRKTPRSRLGFTLIELMIVIVIIGILMALLLPVVMGALRRTNEARVSAEIQTISMGLAKFKDTYGVYPPSRIILSETGVYSLQGTFPTPQGGDFSTALTAMPVFNGTGTTTNLSASKIGNADISFGELAQRSLGALRKFFPKAVLRPADQNGDGTNDYWPDYNGNGVQDAGYIYLEGHESYVFFLGGIPNPSTSNGKIVFGMSGFGKEPLYPFKNPGVVASAMSTANRTAPAYEFKGDRLADDDGDGIPGYLDTFASGGQGNFYAYFNSYGAAGYDPNDVNFGDSGDFGVGNTYRIGFPTVPLAVPPNTFSPTPNPYTTSMPAPLTANQPAAYMNSSSFQIISAGGDGFYGPGGQWSTSGDRLPDPNGVRSAESDNITNFTSGRLN